MQGRWTILTAAGLAIGLAAGVLAGIPLGHLLNAMIATAATVCIAGAILGAFQSAGLRPLLAKPWWWIAATVAGVAAGLAAGVVTVEQVGTLIIGTRPRVAFLTAWPRAISFVTVGAIAGTVLGVAQWLVFRVRGWVFACGVALAIAFSVASLSVDVVGIPFASAPGRIVFLLLSGLMFGALTSWPLRRATLAG